MERASPNRNGNAATSKTKSPGVPLSPKPPTALDPVIVTENSRLVDCSLSWPSTKVQNGEKSGKQPLGFNLSIRPNMLPLSDEQKARFGLELATLKQEHADLDAAIMAMMSARVGDQMAIQRLKKKKLAIKDRIVELEDLVLPDIIA